MLLTAIICLGFHSHSPIHSPLFFNCSVKLWKIRLCLKTPQNYFKACQRNEKRARKKFFHSIVTISLNWNFNWVGKSSKMLKTGNIFPTFRLRLIGKDDAGVHGVDKFKRKYWIAINILKKSSHFPKRKSKRFGKVSPLSGNFPSFQCFLLIRLAQVATPTKRLSAEEDDTSCL